MIQLGGQINITQNYSEYKQAYFQPYRPWFSLYNTYLKSSKSSEQESDEDQVSSFNNLPQHILLNVFKKLNIEEAHIAGLACKSWYLVSQHSELWIQACRQVFRLSSKEENDRQLYKIYSGSLKKMYLQRPHLRFDGIYVARNTYIRTGIAEFQHRNPVHVVVYYRYLRFFSDGTVLFRMSPKPVAKVSKHVRHISNANQIASNQRDTHWFTGKYKYQGDKIFVQILYSNKFATELRFKLRLLSVRDGLNNYIEIQRIMTYDREDGIQRDMIELGDDQEENIQGALFSTRGTAPFVFVKWDQVDTHNLNLSIDQMDYYIPL